MPNLNDELGDELTDRDVAIMRLAAGETREAVGQLSELEKRIIERLKRGDPSEPATENGRNRRLAAILALVGDDIGKTYTGLAKRNEATAEQAGTLEGEHIAAAALALLGFKLLVDGVTEKRAAELAGRLAVEGAPVRDWFERQGLDTLRRYQDALRLGLAEGDDLSGLVARVRGPGLKIGKRIVHPKSLIRLSEKQAQALIETSLAQMANDARAESYQRNKARIRGQQAENPLDGRTSPLCRYRAGPAPGRPGGMAWRLDGRPMPGTPISFPGPPPWHWRCRTSLRPITKSYAELMASDDVSARTKANLERLPASKKAALDGKPARGKTFEEYFSGKTAEQQRKILGFGEEKFRLFKEKKLSFGDLIDQSGRPLTIAELKAL